MFSGWTRFGSGDARDYGATGHPGSIDFEEEALHDASARLTLRQETKRLFQILPRVKLLVLWLLPLVGLLIGFVPLGSAPPLVAVAIGIMCVLVMIPCQLTLTECLEDLVVHHSSDFLGVFVNIFFENASLTLFGVFSVVSGTRHALCFVKSTILGCALFDLLVVVGSSVFTQSRRGAGEGGLSMQTWSAFGSGLLLATTVFLMPTLYDLTVATPDTMIRLARNQTTIDVAIAAQVSHSLLLSRTLSVILLVAYLLYTIHLLRSHYNYFSAAGNPNTPSTLSYVLLYREQTVLSASSAAPGMSSHAADGHMAGTAHALVHGGHGESAVHEGHTGGPRFSRRFALLASFLSFIVLAAVCACLVASLPGALRALPWLSQPLLVVILLPAVFGFGSLGASTLLAQMDRLDISVSIAFSSIMHLFCCVSPVLVIIGWVLQRPLELTFHPFLAVMCFVSVLVTTQLVMWNRAGQLEGITLLTMYVLTVMVCALGGWHMCIG